MLAHDRKDKSARPADVIMLVTDKTLSLRIELTSRSARMASNVHLGTTADEFSQFSRLKPSSQESLNAYRPSEGAAHEIATHFGKVPLWVVRFSCAATIGNGENGLILCGECLVDVEDRTGEEGASWVWCPSCGHEDALHNALKDSADYILHQTLSRRIEDSNTNDAALRHVRDRRFRFICLD